MSLSQSIDVELKEAMRAKDSVKLGVLRMLKSALKYAAIEKGGADAVLEDQDAVPVIRKELKKREDAIASFEQAGRTELAEKERLEAVILSSFLPKPLDGEELSRLVRDSIAESGATSRAGMGAVMKIAAAKAAGRVDGKTLSSEVQRQLKP